MTSNLTCGQAAIALLERYGVDTVFGIPGVHTLEFYRGLAASSIRHIAVRHEQGAGFMADGYARASGRPGVCVLITGPGVTNAATPIGQAFTDSAPMLVLSSVNATADLGKGRGKLHEITNQQAVMAPLTAFSRTVRSASELMPAFADAFRVFESQRPRPVHIEIPLDVMASTGPALRDRGPKSPPPAPDAQAVNAAARLIDGAQRLVILNGGGASECGDLLQALLEKRRGALVPTTAAKGVVPDSHPRSVGSSLVLEATQDLVKSADVVVAVGTELGETDSWVERLPFAGKLVRIDIDPACIVRDYRPDAAILADARAALEALVPQVTALPQGGIDEAEIKALRARNRDSLRPLQQKHLKVLDALRAALPADGIVASDMTQIAYTACHAFPGERPRSYFHPSGYGTLGYALPAAIGAKIAAPERAVVAVAGDTGFLFTVQELATAVEYKLPIPILLWNNDALGQIAGDMVELGIPEIGVKLRNPDFLALGKSFGCRAVRPANLKALKQEIGQAFGSEGPTLIEVREDADFLA
ncbi:MAG: 5-guanidino-2-oxopentanoate decarboxylase [Dongiaceae bacterium]